MINYLILFHPYFLPTKLELRVNVVFNIEKDQYNIIYNIKFIGQIFWMNLLFHQKKRLYKSDQIMFLESISFKATSYIQWGKIQRAGCLVTGCQIKVASRSHISRPIASPKRDNSNIREINAFESYLGS